MNSALVARRERFFNLENSELVALFSEAVSQEDIELIRESFLEAYTREALGSWRSGDRPDHALSSALVCSAKSADFLCKVLESLPDPFLSSIDRELLKIYDTKCFPERIELVASVVNQISSQAPLENFDRLRDNFLVHRMRVCLIQRDHQEALRVAQEMQCRALARVVEGHFDALISDLLWAAMVANDSEPEVRSTFLLANSLQGSVKDGLLQRLRRSFGGRFFDGEFDAIVPDLSQLRVRNYRAFIDCIFLAAVWQNSTAFFFFVEKLGSVIDFSAIERIKDLTITEHRDQERALVFSDSLIDYSAKNGCSRIKLWTLNMRASKRWHKR